MGGTAEFQPSASNQRPSSEPVESPHPRSDQTSSNAMHTPATASTDATNRLPVNSDPDEQTESSQPSTDQESSDTMDAPATTSTDANDGLSASNDTHDHVR